MNCSNWATIVQPKCGVNPNASQDVCGPKLCRPQYAGTLVCDNAEQENLTAMVQQQPSNSNYIMYGVDDNHNILQMLRPRDQIRMTPSDGELVKLAAAPARTYTLSKPYFIDSTTSITY